MGGGWLGGNIPWLRLLATGEQRPFFTSSSIVPFGEGAGPCARDIWICKISAGILLQVEEKNILGLGLKSLRSFEVSILQDSSDDQGKSI